MRGTIMIKSKSELLEAIKTKLGGDTSDETIGLIEDISDTMDDYESKVSDTTNWKEKYEKNDADWRQKYTDRFFSSGVDDGKPEETPDEQKREIKTFDDLFSSEVK